MKSVTSNIISFVLGGVIIFAVMTVLDAAPTPQDQGAQQQVAAPAPEPAATQTEEVTETLTDFDVQDALTALRTQQEDDFAMFGHYLTLIQSLHQQNQAADLYLMASIYQILGDRALEAGQSEVAKQLYAASVPEDRFEGVLSTDISAETRHNYMAQLCRHDHQLELDRAAQSCGYFADESVSYPTRAFLAALSPS